MTCQLFELKHERVLDVDGVCQISCKSVCNFIRRRFLNVLASFSNKSKWRPNHVTCQPFELKHERAMDVDGVCQISCQSVCNFMRRRFLKVLASFSKDQNGGQITWPVNFFELKHKRVLDVDGVCQIPCKSVCNFIRRFLKVLASFSKNQNGGQTTWLVKFMSSNHEDLCM